MKFTFKESHSPSALQQQFLQVRRRNDGTGYFIPIICEGAGLQRYPPRPMKFLVPPGITVGQFMHSVRKRITVSPSDALFFLFGGTTVVSPSLLVSDAYNEHKDPSGFLFVGVFSETVFG